MTTANFAGRSGVMTRIAPHATGHVSSESQRAAALLEQRFHAGKPNLVVLATHADGGSVDDPDAVAAGQALTQHLVATPGITTVSSYWGRDE